MNQVEQYQKIKVEIDRLNSTRVDLQGIRYYLSELVEYIEMRLAGVDEDIKRAEKEERDG